MNETFTKIPSTLDEIIALRKQQLIEVKAQKQVLTGVAKGILSPIESQLTKGQSIAQAFNTGIAVFDGFMLGLKIIRKVRRLFRFSLF